MTNQIIKTNIRNAIKQSGMTQKEIAEKINVKQQTVQEYSSRTKKTLPALDTFAKLCIVLDIDPKEILGIK